MPAMNSVCSAMRLNKKKKKQAGLGSQKNKLGKNRYASNPLPGE